MAKVEKRLYVLWILFCCASNGELGSVLFESSMRCNQPPRCGCNDMGAAARALYRTRISIPEFIPLNPRLITEIQSRLDRAFQEDMDPELKSLIDEFKSFLAVQEDGRVKCTLNGHTMPARKDVVQSFVK